jgi:hypothetical protein
MKEIKVFSWKVKRIQRRPFTDTICFRRLVTFEDGGITKNKGVRQQGVQIVIFYLKGKIAKIFSAGARFGGAGSWGLFATSVMRALSLKDRRGLDRLLMPGTRAGEAHHPHPGQREA